MSHSKSRLCPTFKFNAFTFPLTELLVSVASPVVHKVNGTFCKLMMHLIRSKIFSDLLWHAAGTVRTLKL